MTETTPAVPAQDETWTTGRAARYLNSGGVNFGITARRVRRWADSPDCQIRSVDGGGGRWRRVLASTVRAERARLLGLAGVRDPDWSPPRPRESGENTGQDDR